MKLILSENEKDQISSQHEEIDFDLFSLLMRRYIVEERTLNDWIGDQKPMKITEYRFEGFPGYGFNSFASKKDMQNKILTMLYENDIIEDIFELKPNDPKRIKIVKTIRNFVTYILGN